MTARANPGAEFEAAFRRSIPAGIYTRRLPTPSAVGFRVPQLVELAEGLHSALVRMWGLVRSLAWAGTETCRLCGAGKGKGHAPECAVTREPDPLPDWVGNMRRFGFTPKAGFDLQLTAPSGFPPVVAQLVLTLKRGAPAAEPPRPVLVFDLELKSVAVDRLDFGNVDPGQEKALAAGAAAGHAAALVVEFRKAGEVWVLPIQVWQEYRLTAQRSSMPLADARRLGMPILRDEGRGVKLPYWKIGAWLRECGAEITP